MLSKEKKKRAETQLEWECRIGKEILDDIKREIYIDLPYMELALGALIPEGKEELLGYATDGIYLFFGPEHQITLYQKNVLFLERTYLHTLLHCIYAHLWIAGNRDRAIWNLACDIAVEHVVDQMDKPCTKRILNGVRLELYQKIREEHLISAAQIYEYMIENKEQLDWNHLAQEFYADDHRFWPAPKKNPNQPVMMQNQAMQQWQKIAKQMQLKKDQKGNDTDEKEQMIFAQLNAQRARKSYGDFLKQFARRREVLHLNQDEFDLSYYTYGLKTYGNIPLIEPLETREEKKIKELVIVVDTSYSTSGELVKGFLEETFSILQQKEAFFRNNCVHILQCDDEVRQDIEIRSGKQMEEALRNFQIIGGGNTDFRPAFTYIQKQRENGKIRNLGGLLYFTDGNGIYPKKKPDFKTAFLYLKEYEKEKVPVWAMQLQLDHEELRQAAGKH